ncbi:MAG: hypothetical protein OER95_18370, partial [Acidimicrobiia bacterium]|nr:hypothetical protein [Acidimicrobiia bacterium]
GGTGTFVFAGSNLATPVAPVTTTGDGVAAVSDRYLVTDLGIDVAVTETVPEGWNFVSVECVDNNAALTGNSGVVASSSTADVVIPNAVLVPGADLVCTFVNDRHTSLTITKVGVGGGAAFEFVIEDSATAIIESFSLNPNPPSVPSLSYVIDNAPTDGPLTVTELTTTSADYALVDIFCRETDTSPSGTSSTITLINGETVAGEATVDLVPGADVTCTFTNVKNPMVVVVKNTIGGDATFDYTISSSVAGTSVDDPAFSLTTIDGTATINTDVNGLRPNGPTETDLTITESSPVAVGYELTDLACVDLVTGDSIGVPDLTTGTVVLSAIEAGDEVACVFTNTRKPTITVAKQSIGDAAPFDFETTNLSGAPSPMTLDTSGANPAVSAPYTVVSVGDDVVVTELLTGDWALQSASCIDGGGTTVATTLADSTLTIPAATVAAGRNLICTFVNAAPVIDLAKTAGSVVSGSFVDGSYTVTYEVTATNTGLADGSYSFNDTPTAPDGMSVAQVMLTSTDPNVTTTATDGATSASVSAEPISAGESETWLATVVYAIVDPGAVVAGPTTCDEGAGTGGFSNAITGDDDPSNNLACVDIPIEPGLSVIKTVAAVDGATSPLEYSAIGQLVGYEITVENTGNVPIYDPVVSDAIADAGSIVLSSGDDGDGILQPTETWLYTASRTVTQADLDVGAIDNTALAEGSVDTDGDGAGDTPLQGSDSTSILAVQAGDIEITKSAGVLVDSNGDGVVGGVGDQIAYSFAVTNTGNVTLTNVTLDDALVTVSGDPIVVLAPGAVDSTS